MPPKRILVFQTAFLGDAILCVPLLRALKKIYPESELAFVCRKFLGEIFSASGVCDVVIEVDKKNKDSLKAAFLKTREFKADLIISPHHSFRTAQWVWRLRAPMSIGFSNFINFFAYKITVKRPLELHDVLRQLSLLKPLGVDPSRLAIADVPLALEVPPMASDTFARLLGTTENTDTVNKKEPSYSAADFIFGQFVAIAPGSQWNTKRWTPQGYREVIEKYLRQNKMVVLLGATNERELCEEIARGLPRVLNLAGRTSILELAQILKKAQLLICNDSGTMHVAVSQKTPVVAIFGPTVAAQGYTPWSENAKRVDVDLPCRPCGKHGHDHCPIGTHDCMKKVASEVVFTAAEEVVGP